MSGRTRRTERRRQRGGGHSSDYMGLWYAPSVLNLPLTCWGLKRIAQDHIFHPFRKHTSYATPTTGIVPVGLVLAKQAKNKDSR